MGRNSDKTRQRQDKDKDKEFAANRSLSPTLRENEKCFAIVIGKTKVIFCWLGREGGAGKKEEKNPSGNAQRADFC